MIDLKEGAHWSRSLYEFVFFFAFLLFAQHISMILYSYSCTAFPFFLCHLISCTIQRFLTGTRFLSNQIAKLALPIDSPSKNLGWYMKVNGNVPKHVCNFENFFLINYGYLRIDSKNTLIPIMADNLPKNDWLKGREEELIGKNGPQQFDSSLIRPAAAHRKPLWEETK